MSLAVLEGAIDELAEIDPRALAEPETVIELQRQLERLEAVLTRVAGRFEASGAWCDDGARTASAWLAGRCHLPHGAARRRLGLARALRHLAVAEAAWMGGEIGSAHVGLLDSVRRPATEVRLCLDEPWLVEQAKTLAFSEFARVVAYWAQHADPDGADDAAADDHAARQAHLSQSIGGLWFANAVFDPIGGSVLAAELNRREEELFAADWAEAASRLGRSPAVSELTRSGAQRRADAFVEMAIRSAGAAAGSRRPEPLFTVLVGWETLHGRICELANGTVVAPGALLPWLSEATLERVVFGPRSRVLDVGVHQRLFTGATRRAVEVRDRHCFHSLCDAPVDRCQVDHIIPYGADGPTVQDNGRLACGFHNRERHKRRGPPGLN